MKKSAFVSDVFFAFAAAFFAALCLGRYFSLPFALSALCGILAGAATALPTVFFLKRKDKKARLKTNEDKEKDKLLLHLLLQDERTTLRRFAAFLEKNGADFSRADNTGNADGTDRTNDANDTDGRADTENPSDLPDRKSARGNGGATIAVKNFGDLKGVEAGESVSFFLFAFAPLSADTAIRVLRTETVKKKNVFCNMLSAEAERLFLRFGVETYDMTATYAALKKAGYMPAVFLGESEKTPPAKKLAAKPRQWFAKSNSRRFLLGGAMLLLTSLLTPFPLYYLISGGLLLLSAVLIRIFGYR